MPDGATLSADDVLLSKRELADTLGCSLPTVDRLIERYGIPAAREGGPGVSYGYALADVQRVLGEARAREAATKAQRDELLSGLDLGDFGPSGDTEDGTLTPAQRVQLGRALQIERRNALEAGELLPGRKVKAALTAGLATLGRNLDALPARLGKRHNLPDALVRQLAQEIREARLQMVAGVREALGGDGEAVSDDEQQNLSL